MTDLPQPLTPADCDLTAFEFMPLRVQRLRDSSFTANSSPAEFKAGVLLWAAAWHQVPAASLPDDDAELASLAGFGQIHKISVREWKKVRTAALDGFVLCADGRLYHPVIADLALTAWERRTDFQEKQEAQESRQQRWREKVKRLSQLLRDAGITPPRNAGLEKLVSLCRLHVDGYVDADPSTQETRIDAAEMAKRGRGTGRETLKQHTHIADDIGPAPEGTLAGDPRAWQPDDHTLKTKLVMYGIPAPPDDRIPQLLAEWHDHNAGKHLTEGQCYQKFCNWIRGDKGNEKPAAHQQSARPGPTQRGEQAGERFLARAAARERGDTFGAGN